MRIHEEIGGIEDEIEINEITPFKYEKSVDYLASAARERGAFKHVNFSNLDSGRNDNYRPTETKGRFEKEKHVRKFYGMYSDGESMPYALLVVDEYKRNAVLKVMEVVREPIGEVAEETLKQVRSLYDNFVYEEDFIGGNGMLNFAKAHDGGIVTESVG